MNTNKNSASFLKGGYVWKPEAGRILFYSAIAFVFINQFVLVYLRSIGIVLPIPSNITYVTGAAILVVIHSTITKGWKRAWLGFLLLYLVGFLAEGLGVNYGWVYGPYHYGDFVGTRVWGVPWSIPLSWELFMYPAFYLVSYLLPTENVSKSAKTWQKVVFVFTLALVSGLFCTLYDLLADPVYVSMGAYIWHVPGDFEAAIFGGIPLTNYLGWILTGFVGALVYWLVLETTPAERHIKSTYLQLGVPLVMYVGALAGIMAMNILYLHNESVVLLAILGMGTMICMLLGKFMFTLFGYKYADEALATSPGS